MFFHIVKHPLHMLAYASHWRFCWRFPISSTFEFMSWEFYLKKVSPHLLGKEHRFLSPLNVYKRYYPIFINTFGVIFIFWEKQLGLERLSFLKVKRKPVVVHIWRGLKSGAIDIHKPIAISRSKSNNSMSHRRRNPVNGHIRASDSFFFRLVVQTFSEICTDKSPLHVLHFIGVIRS